MILTSFGGERDDTSVGALPAEGTGFLDTMSDVDHLPPWLSEEDLEAYAGAFAKRGFTGPLNWYRNLDRNWEITEHLSGARVAQPAIFVTGERDPVRKMVPADVMGGFVEDLKDTVVLEGCGHWTQQERPREVNDVLVQFLKSIRDEGRFD
jgi:pimeloyl-ACP methyl ester carboxylesterase